MSLFYYKKQKASVQRIRVTVRPRRLYVAVSILWIFFVGGEDMKELIGIEAIKGDPEVLEGLRWD
jgi:hypothetical protein